MTMRKTNGNTSLGLLFATTVAMVSPMHETMTRRSLYGSVPQLPVRGSIVSLIRRSIARIDIWRRRQSQRRSLGLLSDHMLNDIGLERKDVADELAKPFWQP